MGAGISSEDRMKRQKLENELHNLQYSLHVTATSHYISSGYYKKWDTRLQYASLFTGTFGAAASVVTKLAWEMLVASNPRLAPILAATSTTSLLFTAIVNIPQIQNTPSNLYQMHFKSGIECQYLEKQVKFISATEVWDSKVAWETLAAKYEKLLRDKKEVNSRIQSEFWAYRKALKKIEERESEKKARQSAGAERAPTDKSKLSPLGDLKSVEKMID